jgi:hypothetical protein
MGWYAGCRVCFRLLGRPAGCLTLVLLSLAAVGAAAAPAHSVHAVPVQSDPFGTLSVPFGTLSSVSCVSKSACTAVGGSGSALAERWDGNSWTVQPTPRLAGANASVLTGVSGASRKMCIAVGSYQSGPGCSDPESGEPCTGLPLAELWNGSRWAIQPAPAPAGATFSALNAVSCARKTACAAVGIYLDSADMYVTLAQRWDRRNWQIEPSANTAGTETSLTTVLCPAPTRCIAVGNYIDNTNTNPPSGRLAED